MPSIYDLVYKKSKEIRSLAREYDVEGRGDKNTPGLIVSLADQDVGDDVKELLSLNKTDDGDGLVGEAKELDIDDPSDYKKKELQELVLREMKKQGKIGEGRGPYPSTVGGDDRSPHSSIKSHFDTAEKRHAAIREHAMHGAERALQHRRSQMVVESFRPKDETEPLRVSACHKKRHPDSVVVFECRVSQVAQIYSDLIREMVVKATQNAVNESYSYSVVVDPENVGDPDIEISAHDYEGRVVVYEAFVPRGPYPLKTADPSPVMRRLENE